MNSQERLGQEIKSAMLARDQDRLSALRMLKSAVGYTQIEKKTETLSEADFVVVVQREVKKRRDSIEQFEKGGRPELAEKEKKEIGVLEQFLPKALSPEEPGATRESHDSGIGRSEQEGHGTSNQSRSGESGGTG